MHFNRALAVFAQRPRLEFYACGYGRGVQRINYVVYGYLGELNR